MNAIRTILGLFWLATVTLASGGAQAGLLAAVDASHSRIELYSDKQDFAPGQAVWLGVKLIPKDHWHTYWKNPGDSGSAPILTWTLPDGFSAAEPQFPVPSAIPTGPLVNYGYDGPSVMLVRLATATAADRALSAHLSAEWLVCETECIPQFAELDIELPMGEGRVDPAGRGLFADARALLPEPGYWGGRLDVADKAARLTVYMDAGEAQDLAQAHFFPEAEGVLAYAAPQDWSFGPEGLAVNFIRPMGAPTPESANGILLLDYADGSRLAVSLEPMLELAVTTTKSGAAMPMPAVAGITLWQAALFAFLGGIVLNLMPCVFPVLSLKAFAFLQAGARSEAGRRAEGWAYTFGIWVSFMAVVAVLLALRAGGAAVGWGFQLQEPSFVALMALIMVVVGLSLGGLVMFTTGLEGAGQGLASKEGSKGAFFKGVLATLVATPCTAPFMAPAVGFALAQPVLIVFVIFSLLAFGLALPFLMLSYSPTLARMMPRPGAWMEKVKQGLAFPMFLTAAWLVYIFDRQMGSAATMLLLMALVLVGFAVWLWQQGTGRVLRGFALAFALVGLAGVLWRPPALAPKQHAVGAEDTLFGAEAYSDARLAELAGGADPVFVYFTADWCIICKANETLVLDQPETKALFAGKGIRVLKGDWTNRNAEIAEVLARYGRAGVPLYLYFAPGVRDAKVLPELLTIGIVEDAVLGR